MPRPPRSTPPPRANSRARVAAPVGRAGPPLRATAPLRRVPDTPPAVSIPIQRRRTWRWLRWGIIAAIWGTLALAVVVLWFARDLPRPESALDATRRPSLTLEDRSGHIFARFGDVVGQPLHLSEMPPYLPAAVVAERTKLQRTEEA